ncbi:MAG: hypothetical protein FVQ80_06985 [Planctomycetes bacterium]|nr:hypothetical protein [Planctomycetota bacterium]
MVDYDRKLYRESWGRNRQCIIDIHGNIEVSKGDLLFVDKSNGLRSQGASTADWYGYPFSKLSGSTVTLASNRNLAATNFLGVAAWHSDSGVTEKLAVHVGGLFLFGLKNVRTLKVGQQVIPAGSGVTLYNQKVTTSVSGSSDHVGLVARGGSFQSVVEFSLLTLFSGNTNLIT